MTFGEILVEPACAHDRPRNARRLQFGLGGFRGRLASTGQKDQLLQPRLASKSGKAGNRFDTSSYGDIGLVGDIGARDAVERSRPAVRPLPVERHFGGSRHGPRSDAARLEPRVDASTGLSIGANDEGDVLWHGFSPFYKHENDSYLTKAINSRIP